MKRLFYLIICILCACQSLPAQTVDVYISNLSNANGHVRIAVFTCQSDFENEEPLVEKVFSKSQVNNGKLTVRFSLKPGNYGIALLDDENCDGEMRFNFLGMPLEGYGFSNFESSGFSKPVFSDFDFPVKNGTNKVEIKVQYMF